MSQYWVLFDTATVPDYYADVHRVLSMPSGELIRYEYREKYLDADAIASVETTPSRTPVIVVYGQWDSYRRGDDAPDASAARGSMSWQALRLGEMAECWRANGTAHFQFQVGDYPAAEPSLLAPLIDELASTDSLPYFKWAALSGRGDVLSALRTAESSKQWVAIARRLESELQFRGDVFWRSDPPERAGWFAGRPIRAHNRRISTSSPEQERAYVVPERLRFSLRVHMRSPSHNEPSECKLEIHTGPKGGPISAASGDIVMRRNADRAVFLESLHAHDTKLKQGTLTLETQKSLDARQRGLTLRFLVQLAVWKRILGGVLVTLGILGDVVLGIAALATDKPGDHVGLLVSVALVLSLAAIVGALLYTGRLPKT